MGGSRWRTIEGIDRSQLSEARLQAHYAVQWLARMARAHIAPRPEHGHTNLGWDDAIGGLATHALPKGMVAGLKISELTLVLRDGPGRAGSQAISLDGRRDADIREWLGGQLRASGLEAEALDAPSPYRMPAHPIGHGAPYAAGGLAEALAELAAWYGNADLVLSETRRRMIARGLEAPPVRCWPHHFDLDSLIPLGSGRTIGTGFSPGDDYYDEPYFYVSLHPAPDATAPGP